MNLKQNILTALGYDSLTPMQEAMYDSSQKRGGIVLLSPTGSGKTLAYLLPLVEMIQTGTDVLQAVVVSPTRELAIQIEDVLKRMKTGVRVVSLYGGRPAMQEHRVLKEVNPHVVVGTPGRLNDHLNKDNLNGRGVKLLVIDEFDKCLELGFQDEMNDVVSHFPLIDKCWLMSATDAESIPKFMERVTRDYVKLDFQDSQSDLDRRINLCQVISPNKDKLETLGQLLTYIKGLPTIVFVSHRESVQRVGAWLQSKGFYAVMYHGGMEQDVRERALYKFRNGSANVLVSTDLAARGLDIPEVRAVVHYHMPLKSEEFTHRNGRTARWDSDGTIYLLTYVEEPLPEYIDGELSQVDLPNVPIKPVSPSFTTLYIGRGKSEKLSKGDILGFLCKKGGLKSGDIGRIDVAAHYSLVAILRSKLKSVLSRVSGEKIKGMKTIIEETKKY